MVAKKKLVGTKIIYFLYINVRKGEIYIYIKKNKNFGRYKRGSKSFRIWQLFIFLKKLVYRWVTNLDFGLPIFKDFLFSFFLKREIRIFVKKIIYLICSFL